MYQHIVSKYKITAMMSSVECETRAYVKVNHFRKRLQKTEMGTGSGHIEEWNRKGSKSRPWNGHNDFPKCLWSVQNCEPKGEGSRGDHLSTGSHFPGQGLFHGVATSSHFLTCERQADSCGGLWSQRKSRAEGEETRHARSKGKCYQVIPGQNLLPSQPLK